MQRISRLRHTRRAMIRLLLHLRSYATVRTRATRTFLRKRLVSTPSGFAARAKVPPFFPLVLLLLTGPTFVRQCRLCLPFLCTVVVIGGFVSALLFESLNNVPMDVLFGPGPSQAWNNCCYPSPSCFMANVIIWRYNGNCPVANGAYLTVRLNYPQPFPPWVRVTVNNGQGPGPY